MKSFDEFLEEQKNRCWKGYKPAKGKKPYSDGSCVKEGVFWKKKQPQADPAQLNSRLANMVSQEKANANRQRPQVTPSTPSVNPQPMPQTPEEIAQHAWNAPSPQANPFEKGDPNWEAWNISYMDRHMR